MSRIPLLAAAACVATFALAPAAAQERDQRNAKPAAASEPAKEDERHEPAEGTQQHKMKVCNIQAHEKDLHGDERRAFMSSCLRK